MERITHCLAGGPSREQIQRIHAGALRVLDEVGVEITHDEAQKRLSAHKGVSVRDGRVRFAPDLVDRCVNARSRGSDPPSETIRVCTGGLTREILDLETGQIRPAGVRDLVAMTKLADALDMHGYSPVLPQDLPVGLQDIAVHKVCWENSRDIGGGLVCSPRAAEYIYRMSEVAGRPFRYNVWMISPLKIDDSLFDVVLHFVRNELPLKLNVGTLAAAGATAPIFIPGAFVQALAEVFAGVTAFRLLAEDSDITFDETTCGIEVNPFDMKYTSYVYGSPENTLIVLFRLALHRFYDLPLRAKAFLTMSKQPDAQAAAERAMTAMLAVLAGARELWSAGRISSDEVFSGEQLVIDREIADYVGRIAEGLDFTERDLALDVIKDCTPGKDFISHDTTLENYRRLYRMPNLFEHQLLDQWRATGQASLRDKAREIAGKKIADHEFRLDPDVQAELDRLYSRAAEELT